MSNIMANVIDAEGDYSWLHNSTTHVKWEDDRGTYTFDGVTSRSGTPVLWYASPERVMTFRGVSNMFACMKSFGDRLELT